MVKKSAYSSDIFRTILKNRRRFLSIMIITMLGVMMFSGLKAACVDLRASADRFFDAQDLHDLEIVSTLGLDDDDIQALEALEAVEKVTTVYAEEVSASCLGIQLSASLRTYRPDDLDQPYLLEGRLPVKNNEAAITQRFVKDTGASIGDQITIEEKTGEQEKENFPVKTYTITAIVTDVTDMNNPFGSVAYRDAAVKADTVFIPASAVDSDIYTAAEIRIRDTEALDCFSDAYRHKKEALKKEIETKIRTDREKARTEKIKKEAADQIREAELEVLAELEDARKKLAEALKEYEDGKKQLDEGSAELENGRRTAEKALADAQRLINENRLKLEQEKQNFEKTKQDLLKQIEDLEKNKEDLLAAKAGLRQIDEGIAKIDEGLSQLDSDEMKTIMKLLENLPADTPLSQLEETADGVFELFEELKESGLIPDDISAADVSEALNQAQETILADEEVLREEAVAEQAERLRLADPETPLDEMEEDTQLLQEVLAKYSPGITLDTCGSLIRAYDTAMAVHEAADEIFASEDYQTVMELLEFADGEEDLSTYFEQMKEMPELLAEAAGTDVPETAGELLETWKKAVETLRNTKEDLLKTRNEITSGLEENGIKEDEIDDAIKAIEDGIRQIREGIAYGEAQIADGERQLEAGQRELDLNRISTLAQLDEALREIQEGYKALLEGKKQLDDGWQEYYEGREEAEEEFEKAYKELDDIDTAEWYILDRMAQSGYANIISDADAIESIGTAFPAVFLVVAVLISLTAITRMVEEERGLIGTYKSLGYSNRKIRRKYIVYAALAVAAGAALGTVLAFVALPMFIFTIFRIMYLLPAYHLTFIPLYGLGGPLLFMAAVLIAVFFACGGELSQVPAALMRPKAPKAGSKVFLEYVPSLWKRLSFLGKVTFRNLFRYKKRMLMTVCGIGGCMALLLFGFAINDSVTDLMPRQYDQTSFYDVLLAATGDDHPELNRAVEESSDTEEYAEIMITQAGVSKTEEREESVQLVVLDDDTDTSSYYSFRDPRGNELSLGENDLFITLNASLILDFDQSDTIRLRLADLQSADCQITSLIQNYLGNYVFMRRSFYERVFSDYQSNGFLINLKEGADHAAFTKMLKKQPGVMSVISTSEVKDQFSISFRLITVVVYIVILMSAALAFVVLYTLSSINVSERVREIATIKVLGFFDNEVHSYIDKETVILTLTGIAAGIPLGRLFASLLTSILELPSIYLAVSLHLKSYLISAGLTILFMILVNIFCDRILDQVDPAEALKSVE